MVLVRFSGNPLDRLDISEYRCEASTVREVFRTLPVRGGEPYVRVFRGDERVGLDNPVSDDDELLVAIEPGTGLEAGTYLLIGQLLIGAAGLVAASALFRKADTSPDRDDDSSPTYNYKGISQTRTDHQPVEIGFGRYRHGGTVIGEYIQSSYSPVTSTFYQLISFGFGPFKSIAGLTEDTPVGTVIDGSALGALIFINDNPVENYDDVQVQVRMGTPDQEPLYGFEKIREAYDVGPFELTSQSVDSPDNEPNSATWNPSGWQGTANDAHWTAYARTFDITNPVDEVSLRLNAPSGYYSSNAAGVLIASHFRYAVRYRELDGSDNPITTGGPNGDGWYREQPNSGSGSPIFAQQGSFDYQISVPLYDPQTVTAFATTSNAFSFVVNTTAQNASAPAVSGVATIGAGYPLTGLSVSLWAKVPVLVDGGSVFLCGADSVSGNGGWVFSVEMDVDNSGPEDIYELSLRLRRYDAVGGTTSSSRIVRTTEGAAPPSEWSHYGFTLATDGTVRFFYRGGPGALGFIGDWITWSGEDFCIGHSVNNPTRATSGATGTIYIDQVRVYNAVVTPSQMLSLSQEDNGLSVPTPVSENCLWKLEASPSPNDNVPQHVGDPQWWSEMTLGGGGALATEGGIVPSTSTLGERKRMKVRVELTRTNVDADSTRTQDTMEWIQAVGITDAQLSHPGLALMAISIRASEQLSGRIPTITSIVEALKVFVFKGGDFSYEFSKNPAWHCKEIVENRHWGLPGNYTVDDDQLYEIAQRNDEVVYDGTTVIHFDGTDTHAFSQNLWYDSSVVDETGTQRGGLEIHVPYLDQSTGLSINASLPTQWVPGHFIRLRGWPDDTNPSISFDVNTPNGSDGSGSGGYEIYEIGLDASTSGVTHSPGFHIIRAYFLGRGVQGPPPTFFAGGAYQQDGSATNSLGAIVDPVDGIIPDTAIVEGGERRFEFNGVHDRASGGWDSLQKIAAVARAAPYRDGKKIRFRQSHADEPAFLITQSSIVKDSLQVNYSAKSGRTNAFDLLISNKHKRYDRDTVPYVDTVVVNPTDTNVVRREQLELFGVTSPAQALRHGKYVTKVNRLLLRDGEFKIGPSGLSYEIGDVFRIAVDLLPRAKGFGGRCLHYPPSTSQILPDSDDLTAWTASNVSVASVGATSDVTGTAEMFSVEDASATETGYIEQESPQILPGVYCLGLQAEHDSGSSLLRVELENTDNADDGFWAIVDLSDGSVNSSKEGGDGEVSVTDIGGGFHFIYIWSKFSPRAAADRLRARVYPAAVAVANQGVTNIGAVTLSAGKHPVFSHTVGHAVCLEREAVLDGDESCKGMTVLGGMVTATGITNDAGTYSRGQVVFFTTPFLSDPGRPGQYTFLLSGSDGALAEVTGRELGENLETTISWLEYNADVFDDRSTDLNEAEALISDDSNGSRYLERVPDRVSITGAQDWSSRTVSGSVVTNIRVWWTPVESDAFLVAEIAVWTRASGDERGRWNKAGTAQAADGFADVRVSDGSVGTRIDVAIQPISSFGARRHVDRCARTSVAIRGRTTLPLTPLSVGLRISGLRAVHSWACAESDRSVSMECRRGGWILGQRVFVSDPGSCQSQPTTNWVGSDFTTTKLQYRTRSSAQGYSQEPYYLEHTPSIVTDAFLPIVTEQTKAWEVFSPSNGWEAVVPSASDPDIGAEFEQDSDGSLRYKSSSTETSEDAVVWTSTASSVVPTSGRVFMEPRRVVVEAYYEAEQVAPDDWDPDERFDSYDATRRSAEGPVTLLSGEASATLRCQINVNQTGMASGWTGWHDYAPGEYSVADIRFRLVATRPAVNFNIAVHKFHTRVVARVGRLDESTPHRRSLEAEIF